MDKLVALNSADGETVDSIGDKCYICLCPFEKQTVGSLDQCPHFFCFQCIYQWSQVNTNNHFSQISMCLYACLDFSSWYLQHCCPSRCNNFFKTIVGDIWISSTREHHVKINNNLVKRSLKLWTKETPQF